MSPLKSSPKNGGRATDKAGSPTHVSLSSARNQSKSQDSSHPESSKVSSLRASLNCPYHGPIINLPPPPPETKQSSSPLDRYLNAPATEDPGVFGRVQTGTSLNGCTCGQVPYEYINELAQKAMTALGDMARTQFE